MSERGTAEWSSLLGISLGHCLAFARDSDGCSVHPESRSAI
jgi:hypothetical protein